MLQQGSSSSGAIVKRVALTSAQFKTTHTTPIDILAAPATGTVNVLYSVVQYFTYVAPAYTAVNYVELYTINDTVENIGTFEAGFDFTTSFAEQLTTISGTNTNGQVVPVVWPMILTTALTLTTDATPATGNGTLVYLIMYENKSLV